MEERAVRGDGKSGPGEGLNGNSAALDRVSLEISEVSFGEEEEDIGLSYSLPARGVFTPCLQPPLISVPSEPPLSLSPSFAS